MAEGKRQTLEGRLNEIPELDDAALGQAWTALFRHSPPPTIPRRLLELAAAYEAQAKVDGGLSKASRRKLLDLLHANDGRTLNELCEHLDMSRQGVTQHLAVLEAANLVATLWRGREKLHFLNPVPLQEIYERWIAKFEKPRLKALGDLKRRLEKSHG